MDPGLNESRIDGTRIATCLTNSNFVPAAISAGDGRGGESAIHRELKRLALVWAQENGYPIAALEVSLPNSRYRADVAGYRPERNGTLGHTVVFECKQSRPDLRRDDYRSPEMLRRLEAVYCRQQVLERNLRVHYPTLRSGEMLFPEWDDFDFARIEHRGYRQVVRELSALQNQLRDGRKFEKLCRYRSANLFYLVAPNELMRLSEVPVGWGLLTASEGRLELARKPVWHDSPERARLRVLQRIATAGTRRLNRHLEIELVRPALPQEKSSPVRQAGPAGRPENSS
jgi:hypothetical protein